MSQPQTSSARRALLIVLALLLAVPYASLIPSGTAQVPGCQTEALQKPLFITNVKAKLETNTAGSTVTPDGAIFVNANDQLTFTLTVKNRVEPIPACTALQQQPTSDVRARITYPAASITDREMDGRCDLTGGQSCSTSIKFRVTVPATPPGEQRVRFVVGNGGGNSFIRLAGAERIIVVELKPDLQIDEIVWKLPAAENDRHTTYGASGASQFEAKVANVGTYPAWNPNAGRTGGVNPASNFVCSAFDAALDGDERPDHSVAGSCPTPGNPYFADTAPDLPECIADTPPTAIWPNTMVCSYRRGAPLDMPIYFEVREKGKAEVLESGVSTAFTNQAEAEGDKQTSLLHAGNEEDDPLIAGIQSSPNTLRALLDALDRTGRAGEYDLEVWVDRDAAAAGFTPESSETNNNQKFTANVFGVDLRFGGTPGIVGVGSAGQGGCGIVPDLDAPNGPCPAGGDIVLTASYKNAGNSEVDTRGEVLNREWKAAVYINGAIAQDQNGVNVVKRLQDVAQTTATTSQLELWTNLRIPSDSEGGLHIVEIRLDHVDNYFEEQLPPATARGRVAERRDNFDTGTPACTLPVAQVDNAFCLKLYFADTTDPIFGELSTDIEPDAEDLVHVTEGEDITFSARVEDNSLEKVEALFTDPEGQETAVDMTFIEEDGPEQVWNLTTSFTELIGEFAFKARATDAFGHVATSPEGIDFVVEEWAKHIELVHLSINTQTDFATPENIPVYEGTAAEDENILRVEAEISETGQVDVAGDLDPFMNAGKEVWLFDPEGELRATVPMGNYTVCDLSTPLSTEGTGTGADCDVNEVTGVNGGGQTVDNVRPRFYVYTACSTEEGTAVRDLCAPGTDWPNVDLNWVGQFNIAIAAHDIFGRSNTLDNAVAIADVDGPADISDVTFSPLSANPGQVVHASAEVTDALYVERVFLRVTKPDNTVEELNLTLETVTAAATANGTYTGDFDTGAFKDIDQAGTYDVELVAFDFGRTEAVEALADFRLNDTDTPLIKQFYTIPPTAQEETGPVTWEAEIVDSTAIRSPTLTLTRPASGTTTHTLVFDEEKARWTFTLTADAADTGVWTYALDVADFSGKTARATGSIRVEANLAPQAVNWVPDVEGPDGTSYGPSRPTISVDILDYGSGVELASIKMTVNDEEVPLVPAPRAIPNGFRVTYPVPANKAFADGATVTVKVDASDLSEPEPLVATSLTHQFTVDATAPTATFDANPSLVRNSQRIVGLASALTVEVTDADSGPGDVTVTVAHLAGTTRTAQEQITLEGGGAFKLSELDKVFQGHGNYVIQIVPADGVGNEGAQLEQRVLFDGAKPKIRVFAQPGQPREAIFVNITDDSTIASAVAKYKADGGAEATVALTLEGGTWEGRIPAFPRNTTIEFIVEATDFFGNVGSSPPDTFRAGDAVPTITLTSPKEGDVLEDTIQVRWTASDLETQATRLRVSLYYKRLSEDFLAIPDAQNLANLGQYPLDTTLLPNGDLVLQAIVFDGTNFGDSKVQVVVRNLGKVFSNPEIAGLEPVNGRIILRPGQEVVFQVGIAGQASKVWANVTQDGAAVLSVPLVNSGEGSWRATFQAPTEEGDYAIDLAALTPEGPAQTKGAYTFTVSSVGGASPTGFVPEWTILSILFAAALAVGIVGLAQRWK